MGEYSNINLTNDKWGFGYGFHHKFNQRAFICKMTASMKWAFTTELNQAHTEEMKDGLIGFFVYEIILYA